MMVKRGLAVSIVAVGLPLAVSVGFAPLFVIAVLFLLYLPGRVVIKGTGVNLPPLGNFLLSLATGMSLLPLFVYVGGAVFPVVDRVILGGYVMAFVIYAGVVYRKRMKALIPSFDGGDYGQYLLVGIGMMLSVVLRVLPVHQMNAPLFADPAVEGTIARMVAAGGRIPPTWEPFASLSLHHQPGLPILTASIHIVSGISIPRVILLLGQMAHVLFPLAVFVLADTVISRRKALFSGFVALLSAFPLYSFIAGMNSANLGILIGLVAVAMTIHHLRSQDRRLLPVLVVLGAGALLVHPLSLVVAGLLIAPVAIRPLIWGSDKRRRLRKTITGAAAVAVLPLTATLPYYAPIFRQSGRRAAKQFAMQSSYIVPGRALHPFHLIEPFYMNFLNRSGAWYIDPAGAATAIVSNPVATFLLVSAVGGVYLWYRGEAPGVPTAAAWYLLFLSFSTVQAALRIPFPGHTFIYPSRMKFVIIIPIAVLAAAGMDSLNVSMGGRRVPVLLIALLAFSPLALFTSVQHLHQLAADPVVEDADVEAIRWLGDNTAGDAVVMNALTDVEAGAFIGGPGQWIPAYTGNPVVFPATSLTGNVTTLQDRRQLWQALLNRDAEAFQQQLERYNVSYIYLSRNRMDGRGPETRIPVDVVRSLCNCTTAYENQDVSILARLA